VAAMIEVDARFVPMTTWLAEVLGFTVVPFAVVAPPLGEEVVVVTFQREMGQGAAEPYLGSFRKFGPFLKLGSFRRSLAIQAKNGICNLGEI
jgi:hypothetical protein